MTDKELHKLRRQDLLQLMLEQGKETLALQMEFNEINAEYIQVKAGYDRLKEKLDEKDAVIEKLKKRLDEKDAVIEKLKKRLNEKDAAIEELKIHLDEKDTGISELEKELETIRIERVIQLEETGPIAEAARQLKGVFKEAQKAADKYLYYLQLMCDQKLEGITQRDTVTEAPKTKAGDQKLEGITQRDTVTEAPKTKAIDMYRK
jgi:chromosome segregation ATPase